MALAFHQRVSHPENGAGAIVAYQRDEYGPEYRVRFDSGRLLWFRESALTVETSPEIAEGMRYADETLSAPPAPAHEQTSLSFGDSLAGQQTIEEECPASAYLAAHVTLWRHGLTPKPMGDNDPSTVDLCRLIIEHNPDGRGIVARYLSQFTPAEIRRLAIADSGNPKAASALMRMREALP